MAEIETQYQRNAHVETKLIEDQWQSTFHHTTINQSSEWVHGRVGYCPLYRGLDAPNDTPLNTTAMRALGNSTLHHNTNDDEWWNDEWCDDRYEPTRRYVSRLTIWHTCHEHAWRNSMVIQTPIISTRAHTCSQTEIIKTINKSAQAAFGECVYQSIERKYGIITIHVTWSWCTSFIRYTIGVLYIHTNNINKIKKRMIWLCISLPIAVVLMDPAMSISHLQQPRLQPWRGNRRATSNQAVCYTTSFIHSQQYT